MGLLQATLGVWKMQRSLYKVWNRQNLIIPKGNCSVAAATSQNHNNYFIGMNNTIKG